MKKRIVVLEIEKNFWWEKCRDHIHFHFQIIFLPKIPPPVVTRILLISFRSSKQDPDKAAGSLARDCTMRAKKSNKKEQPTFFASHLM